MTVSIVDCFKAVNVEHDQRQGMIVAPKRLELALQKVLKGGMIVQTGEPVPQRQLLGFAVFPGIPEGEGNLIGEG